EKLEGEIGPRLIHMVHNIQDALNETHEGVLTLLA
ncbi:hypothetical protein, partial [Acinetobacter nosocomialis]